jgi:hypothetical protein
MRESTTDYVARLRSEFQADPINRRVRLPDGSDGLVRSVIESAESETLYKVQRFDRGRFGLSCWFTVDELRLVYFTAGISPDWPRTRSGLN